MALFDKLKEKVSSVVDVDKLEEMANKTVASVKQEVAKAIDPTIKEQERLAKEKELQEQREQKEKELQEQREQEEREKEKRINDFFASINLNEEFEYIFNVLEKSSATAVNFEKGVDHMLSKTETTLSKEEILPVIKKELFTRAFSDTECEIAKVVAIDYFVHDVVDNSLFYKYAEFEIYREGGYFVEKQEPFVKALYGVAGHAVNYLNNRLAEGDYRTMTSVDFGPVIENSNVLKSYTDRDPFTAEDVRAKWAEDLCNSPLQIVKFNELDSFFNKEEYVDALYYYTYLRLCTDGDPSDGVDISKIANAYLEYLKALYDRINR
jgi:hypothetical protein